jgi:hypothetical protein
MSKIERGEVGGKKTHSEDKSRHYYDSSTKIKVDTTTYNITERLG